MMTNDDKEAEKNNSLFHKKVNSHEEKSVANILPTIDEQYLKKPIATEVKFNFKMGFLAVCLDKII